MSTPFTCKPAQRTFIGSSFSMTYRPLVILALMLTLFITKPAFSSDFKQGLDAYNKGDYVTALEQWRPLAKQGYPGAQYNLGFMYETGRGVPQDYKTAIKWFSLAAEQNNPDAQYNLGFMHNNGQGVLQDHKAAVKWYTLAAEQGHADAQLNLGVMYRLGQGVPQDYKTAIKWFSLAAEQNNPEAQHSLGLMYVLGWGVPQDYVYGYMWLNIATANGKDPKGRDITIQKMTPSQIEEAQILAREWMVRHGD